ncbi:MAG: TRAP transporter substrate-binding protein [Succinivibrio sp.]|nr:TRAP transporter substrate-binding protein [Succinivibrio sp.]
MRVKHLGAVFIILLSVFGLNLSTAEETLTLRLGFVDPANASYPRGGQKFADELYKLSGGRVKVQVVANGQLGGEKKMLEDAAAGKLEMFSVVNSVLSQYVPEMAILDLPFLFDTSEQAQSAVDGKLGELIRRAAERYGVHILGFLESGFRDVFSSKPVETPSDFKGLKLRTMENQMQMALFKALGAEVYPMPAHEQYAALKEGKIDANENAIGNMLVNRYYKLIKHVTNTHHQYTFVMIGISDKAWQQLPEDLKPLFYKAMQKAVWWQRNDLKEINEHAIEVLKLNGVQFHDIDRKKIKEKVVPAIGKLNAKVPQEWLDAYYEVIAP